MRLILLFTWRRKRQYDKNLDSVEINQKYDKNSEVAKSSSFLEKQLDKVVVENTVVSVERDGIQIAMMSKKIWMKKLMERI